MTLPSSGTISFNDLQVEFGGFSPIGINEYYRGAAAPSGYIANHENDSTIPNSGTVSLSNYYGTSVNFQSNAWTRGSSLTTTNPTYYTTFHYVVRQYGYVGVGPTYGTKGSIDLVGTSRTSLAQATTTQVINYVDIRTDFPSGTIISNTQNAYIYFNGDVRGTWFSSVTVNGTTLNRTAAVTPGGTYTGSETYWLWNTGWSMPNANGDPFTFSVVVP